MREVAAHVETVDRTEPAKGTWRFYADAAAHLVDPLPYAVGKAPVHPSSRGVSSASSQRAHSISSSAIFFFQR
jgi:hypothetical protein